MSLMSTSANLSPKRITTGVACLGYTVIGKEGLLLIARSTKEHFVLPDEGDVYTIKVGTICLRTSSLARILSYSINK